VDLPIKKHYSDISVLLRLTPSPISRHNIVTEAHTLPNGSNVQFMDFLNPVGGHDLLNLVEGHDLLNPVEGHLCILIMFDLMSL
jgi:hypothetical protein